MIRRDFMKLTGASAALGVIGLAGCSSDGGGGGGAGGELSLGLISAPRSFDPSVAEWGNLLPYYQAAYDSLLLATTEGEIAPRPTTPTTRPRPPSRSRSARV